MGRRIGSAALVTAGLHARTGGFTSLAVLAGAGGPVGCWSTFMDYSNTYGLHSAGVYAVRFGYLGTWTITELGQRMAGRSIDLPDLRSQFARVLRIQLPPHQTRRGW